MNVDFLRRVPLFQGLTDEQLAEILLLGVVKDYPKDAVVFEEGTESDRFYVIYHGSVRVSKILQQVGEEALAILEPGDFFGEMSFLDSEQHSARVVAHEDAQLLEIGNLQLKELLAARPDIAIAFLWAFCRTLSQRIRETNAKFSTLFTISRVF
jgi:CRP-like cAMP-binding protein